MRGTRSSAVALLLASLLAACGGGSGEPAPSRTPVSSVPSSGSVPFTAVPPTATSETGSGPPSGSASSPRPAPSTSRAPAPAPPPPRTTSTAPVPPPRPTSGSTALACAGKDYETVPTSQRVVALTVDAGGDDAGLARILDVLATQHVRATFFVTGRWAQRYPDGVRAIAAAGHLIGNHTTTHPHLPQLSDTAIRAELQTADQTVAALTGRTTKPLFRFPFGDRDARSLAVVNGAGYCAVRWTVDTLGWKGTSGGSSTQSVVARVLAGLRPGEVVLLHAGANPDDGTTLDADALPSVIAEIRSRGYGFTTLAGFSS